MGQTTDTDIERFFTKPKNKAYDQIQWKKHSIGILPGVSPSEQKDVEFPVDWSLNAINTVARKYFIGTQTHLKQEESLKQLVDRIVDTITARGSEEDYFENRTTAETFREELKYILVTQRAAFNPSVWTHVGAASHAQQISEHLILSLEDAVPTIINRYIERQEVVDAGVNLSSLRSSVEPLSKGSDGMTGSPLSFMRGVDALGGTIKDDKQTFQPSRLVLLNIDHPDIETFIWSKAVKERKARDLQAAGWDVALGGKDEGGVMYQNTNLAVRVTDDFMQAVVDDSSWNLKSVTTGETVKTMQARELFRQFAEAVWESANPSMQFDTTINRWHTTPNVGYIQASSSSGEYMQLDDSTCNVATLNVLKYMREDNTFDVTAFKQAVEIVITAQEILVGYGEYPTDTVAKKARAYRQLGIGYTNLGAFLMAQGVAYDSDEGRAQAAAITALMTGYAYAMSARIAKKKGPFAGFHKDREAMLRVLRLHRAEISKINAALVSEELLNAATNAWDEAVELGERYGVRNAQASALTSTNTIEEAMMDCETAGIEPQFSLLKEEVVDGSTRMTVHVTVSRAMKSLGYTQTQITDMLKYLEQHQTMHGAPSLQKAHETVFACSRGENPIKEAGHLSMMAAVQPFLSGGIGKTVQVSAATDIEDIERLCIEAWKMGLKAVAFWREKSKVLPASAMQKKEDDAQHQTTHGTNDTITPKGVNRRELPRIRKAKIFSFKVDGSNGYMTVGEYEDGTPGEIYVTMSNVDATSAGIIEAFARSVSCGLQYGVPLKSYIEGLSAMDFVPAGVTNDPEVGTASSIIDYICRRLALSYVNFDDRVELGISSVDDVPPEQLTLS